MHMYTHTNTSMYLYSVTQDFVNSVTNCWEQ